MLFNFHCRKNVPSHYLLVIFPRLLIMTCNHLLVIGEVLSGKTRYVEELLESEDNNYKGHELIWVFHDTMSMERWENYHDRFHFEEYSFYPLARAQDLKSLMSALMGQVSIGLFTPHCRL